MGEPEIDFELRVSPDKVAELTAVLRDANPLWSDPEAAAEAGFAGPLAPPTYPVLEAWQVGAEDLRAIGPELDYDRVLHATQAFSYARPLAVGETLGGRIRCAEVRRRDGRSGSMTFVTYRTELRDAGGDQVARSDRILVEIEGSRPDPDEQRARVEPEPPAAVRARDLDPIDRIDFARYAGASGDFNPMHVDERAALALGEPSVFGHGMLTVGLLAAAATEWCGDPVLGYFSARIAARVWPGDVLRCEAGEPGPDGSTELRVRRHGAEGGWQTAVTAVAAGIGAR